MKTNIYKIAYGGNNEAALIVASKLIQEACQNLSSSVFEVIQSSI